MRTNRLRIYTMLLVTAWLLYGCQAANPALREFDVQAGDVSLHGRMAGNPRSGCVLLAINGGPGLSSNYMLDLERLAGKDCAVVTYDQRGMGKSSAPGNPGSPESYTLLKYVEDLEAIRQETGAERAHLFGHSFGGIVAMKYASVFPERVNSLIFFGSGPPTWKDIETSQGKFSQRVLALIEQGIIPAPDQWKEGEIDPLLAAYFSDPGFTFPAEARGGAPEFSQSVNELTYANLRALDLRAELTELRKPVLLMFGQDDPFGLQMADSVREALPNASLELLVIERCGHFWHECPEAFYSRLGEFLKLPGSGESLLLPEGGTGIGS